MESSLEPLTFSKIAQPLSHAPFHIYHYNYSYFNSISQPVKTLRFLPLLQITSKHHYDSFITNYDKNLLNTMAKNITNYFTFRTNNDKKYLQITAKNIKNYIKILLQITAARISQNY